MISKDKEDKLVRIYFYICVDSSDKFKELQFYCERFSNNSESTFTDQEIMTLYLYTMHPEEHTNLPISSPVIACLTKAYWTPCPP